MADVKECGTRVRTIQAIGPIRAFERGHAIRNLRKRDVHRRTRIAIQTAIAHIGDYADDLARGFVKLRTNALADDRSGPSADRLFGQY